MKPESNLNPGDILTFKLERGSPKTLRLIKLLERRTTTHNSNPVWTFSDLSNNGIETSLAEKTILQFYKHVKQVTQQELDEVKTGLEQWLKGEHGEHP